VVQRHWTRPEQRTRLGQGAPRLAIRARTTILSARQLLITL
jgi:hypothetical protein